MACVHAWLLEEELDDVLQLVRLDFRLDSRLDFRLDFRLDSQAEP